MEWDIIITNILCSTEEIFGRSVKYKGVSAVRFQASGTTKMTAQVVCLLQKTAEDQKAKIL